MVFYTVCRGQTYSLAHAHTDAGNQIRGMGAETSGNTAARAKNIFQIHGLTAGQRNLIERFFIIALGGRAVISCTSTPKLPTVILSSNMALLIISSSLMRYLPTMRLVSRTPIAGAHRSIWMPAKPGICLRISRISYA